MRGNTNRLVTQEGQERYGNNAAAGAMVISKNNDNFVDAAAELDAAKMEESAAMARS